jgi:SAM-dependent methyltransferase
VVRFAPSIRDGGAVLDVACGEGRHARWLAAAGYRVTGVDRDADALVRAGAAEAIVADLERDAWPLPGRTFDGVVVTNYLHRPLFADLVASLAAGGVLIYETFAAGNARYGRPSNPDFLLEPGELLVRCSALDIVAFEDGLVGGDRPASVQRICAVRRADAAGAAVRHALSR